ncbi:MAG: hypothetical protein B6D77_03460 [gamma proteobacterium symbiont of Ctena orbiculata]|nr:MAG: hypothetical protein B6D77_03460 [gamma proteobacterium symbiont of Ctena orbiculata]
MKRLCLQVPLPATLPGDSLRLIQPLLGSQGDLCLLPQLDCMLADQTILSRQNDQETGTRDQQ